MVVQNSYLKRPLERNYFLVKILRVVCQQVNKIIQKINIISIYIFLLHIMHQLFL